MSKRRVLGKVPPAAPQVPAVQGNIPSSNGQKSTNIEEDDVLNLSQDTDGTRSERSASIASTPDTLQCPICNDTMLTLAQLNKHLDDVHTTPNGDSSIDGNSNGVLSDNDFKQWFKRKVVDKAQDVLRSGSMGLNDSNGNGSNGSNGNGPSPRKLKLDFFDNSFTFSESDSKGNSPNLSKPDKFSNGTSTPMKKGNSGPATFKEQASQQLIVLPREHWKKPVGNDTCHMKGCNKHLNIKNGTVNCRKCGYLFCNNHTFYRIRLNTKLEYDSNEDTSVWCRCCETCFLEKPGWNENEVSQGHFNDSTAQFKAIRKKFNDKKSLEVMVLEKRLLRFFEFYEKNHNPRRNIKKFEREVCGWEDDKDVTNCRICNNRYQFFLLKKHHCRICGLTVCGDVMNGCSMEVPINLLIDLSNIQTNQTSTFSKKLDIGNGEISKIDDDESQLRVCITCKKQLFDKKLFYKDVAKHLVEKSEVFNIIDNVSILKYKIAKILPDFTKSMELLEKSDQSLKLDELTQDENKMETLDKTSEIIQRATRQRVTLVNYFTKLENLAKRMALIIKINEERLSQGRELDISVDEFRIVKSLYQVTISYLQENMSPLQKLPKNLKNKSKGSVSPSAGTPNPEDSATSPQPASAKLTKREVRELREKLMVLKEQQFLVSDMAESAKKQRRFDDFAALEKSINELSLEIVTIEETLGDEYAF